MTMRYKPQWIQDIIRKGICSRLAQISELLCHGCTEVLQEDEVVYYSNVRRTRGVVCWKCSSSKKSLRLGPVVYVREWCSVSGVQPERKESIGTVIPEEDWRKILSSRTVSRPKAKKESAPYKIRKEHRRF